MTNEPPPNLGNTPEPNRRLGNRFSGLKRLGLILAIVLPVGTIGISLWGWFFVKNQLAPLVSKNLSDTLKRPFKLGQVEKFSAHSLRFGASELPATLTDPDRLSVESVEVSFDPLKLLLKRQLQLNITLIKPEIYLEQDQTGKWIDIDLKQDDSKGPIETNIETVAIQNGGVVIFPFIPVCEKKAVKLPCSSQPIQPIVIQQINGTSSFYDKNQHITFSLDSKFASGGNLKVDGETHIDSQETNLQVAAKDLVVSEINHLVQLPVDVWGGRLNSDLKLIVKGEEIKFAGMAELNQITAKAAQVPQPLSQITGKLQFQDTQIKLENLAASYGKIPFGANGQVDIKGLYSITAKTEPVSFKNALETLKIKSPITALGELRTNLQLTGTLATSPGKDLVPPVISGTVVTTKTSQIDRLLFNSIITNFQLIGSTIAITNLQAVPLVGGEILGDGKIQLEQPGNISFTIRGQNLPGDELAAIYGAKSPIRIGAVGVNANIFGSLKNIQTNVLFSAPGAIYPARGELMISSQGTTYLKNATLQVGGGTAVGQGIIGKDNWQVALTANSIQLGQLFPQIPPQLRSPITGKFNLAGRFAGGLSTVNGSGSGSFNAGGGTVIFNNINLAGGRWQTNLETNNVQLGEVFPQVPAPLRTALNSRLNLSGSLDNFSLGSINGTGIASLAVGGGTLTATNINLARGNWQTSLLVNQVNLSPLFPQLPKVLQSPLTGNMTLAGKLDNLSLNAVSGNGNATIAVGGGTLTATNISLAAGNWRTNVRANQVNLSPLFPQLPKVLQSPLTGNMTLAGRLDNLSPNAVSGNGNATIAVGGGTLTATNINLAAGNWQTSVAANNIDMKALAQLVPISKLSSEVQGSLSVNMQAKGSLTAFSSQTIQASGKLQVQNFIADGITFAPQLNGDIQAIPGQGFNLQLVGTQANGKPDLIALKLDRNYQLQSFNFQTNDAVATGTRRDDLLLVKTDNFPASIIKAIAPLPPLIATSPISGKLSGDATINLVTLALNSDMKLKVTPVAGTEQGGEYTFKGDVSSLASGSQVKGDLNIVQGQVQEILTALQIFDLSDFGRGINPPIYNSASSLQFIPVGLPNASLQAQLRRLSEIKAFLEQQRQQRQTSSPIPELQELQGIFNGKVAIAGSLKQGIKLDFDVKGQNWQWGDNYSSELVAVKGTYENGAITFLPLRFSSGESVVVFSGTLGGEQQSGQLRIRNLPVESLQEFVVLPIDVTGKINASATLAGSIQDPQARGEVTLIEGTLNGTLVESARASFNYARARLDFGSNAILASEQVAVNSTEATSSTPIEVNGSLPYKLPFASVLPETNQITLNANVQNEGLALINLLTRGKVAWVDGIGKANLQIRGLVNPQTSRVEDLIAEGIATVDKATVKAQALPEPLTEVNGKVLFNFDRIQVEKLQGKFGGGDVIAQGTLPIAQALKTDTPLTVSLNQLVVNLKGLYSGSVRGQVAIGGTALAPKVGGELQLFNGEVQLAENATPGEVEGAALEGSTGKQVENGNVAEFNNLKLVLNEGIEITKAPILTFAASGSLTLNGPLDGIRPAGKIKLERGLVNLFTTQFRLARGYEHTAQFFANQGLDPTLDIRLTAAVQEVTRQPTRTNTLSSEVIDVSKINATNFGSVQTVRIEARVTGAASQLFDNLELKSNPSRNETELLALMGGGFVETLGRGDSTLGLANLAGSALLGNIQNIIGDAIGLSEFRLFPTLVNSDKSTSSSTLGLAAEIGVEITPQISASVLSILTANQSPQLNIRYRLNEQFLLRGSTDFSGENRAVVEYELRF